MSNTPKAEIDTAENKYKLTENPVRTPQGYALSAVLMLDKISRGQKPVIILTMQNVPTKPARAYRVMTRDGAQSPHAW